MPDCPHNAAASDLAIRRHTARGPGFFSFCSPLGLAASLWSHRHLIRQLATREVRARYRSSTLGLCWTLLHPLVMLLIYTTIFGVVFQARWPDARSTHLPELALIIFCGMVVFHVFSETVNAAPTLVTSHPNYVKKVVFPLELLAVSQLIANLFQALVNFGLLLLAHAMMGGPLQLTVLLAPVLLLPLLLLTLGAAWLLAALGVFVRDLRHIVPLAVTALFFLTPIFYSSESLPTRLAFLGTVNPLAFLVDTFRGILLWGRLPDLTAFVTITLGAGLFMLLSYAFFMRSRRGFADIL